MISDQEAKYLRATIDDIEVARRLIPSSVRGVYALRRIRGDGTCTAISIYRIVTAQSGNAYPEHLDSTIASVLGLELLDDGKGLAIDKTTPIEEQVVQMLRCLHYVLWESWLPYEVTWL